MGSFDLSALLDIHRNTILWSGSGFDAKPQYFKNKFNLTRGRRVLLYHPKRTKNFRIGLRGLRKRS